MAESTTCETGALMGAEAIRLRNGQISVTVLPRHGGKLASVYYAPKQFELLFQNPKPGFTAAEPFADFSAYEACGFDDAFPCIDPCELTFEGRTLQYPDHGEVWAMPMEATCESGAVHLCGQSALLPYTYHKSVSIRGSSVFCRWNITNTGAYAFPYNWAMHCLVNLHEGMELLAPPGERETVFLQPGMHKWYLRAPVRQGMCGWLYPTQGVRAEYHYDATKLPHLSYWETCGGYRGDHNAALEPATCRFDSVADAVKAGKCPVLRPHEELTFCIEIRLAPV